MIPTARLARVAGGKFGTLPRHLMSISDLQAKDLAGLVISAWQHKLSDVKPNRKAILHRKTIAMMFSKRSTRTRVSTEAAVALLGGHPMFLGREDIQLGVNESLYDTAKIVSSMTSCIFARVGPHSDVTGLAEASSVPVINALSDDFHPLQTIADLLTMTEASGVANSGSDNVATKEPVAAKVQAALRAGKLGLEGQKVAWIGDSNNVLFDLATGCIKMGVDIAVASPAGYSIPPHMKELILSAAEGVEDAGKLTETTVPEEAIKGADYLVTDTWVSMGQEEDAQKRLRDFEGYQITNELAERGGAKPDWKFMHCLPRHQEEVADEVFYSPRSLVFPEGENRLWAAVSVLDKFIDTRVRPKPHEVFNPYKGKTPPAVAKETKTDETAATPKEDQEE